MDQHLRVEHRHADAVHDADTVDLPKPRANRTSFSRPSAGITMSAWFAMDRRAAREKESSSVGRFQRRDEIVFVHDGFERVDAADAILQSMSADERLHPPRYLLGDRDQPRHPAHGAGGCSPPWTRPVCRPTSGLRAGRPRSSRRWRWHQTLLLRLFEQWQHLAENAVEKDRVVHDVGGGGRSESVPARGARPRYPGRPLGKCVLRAARDRPATGPDRPSTDAISAFPCAPPRFLYKACSTSRIARRPREPIGM